MLDKLPSYGLVSFPCFSCPAVVFDFAYCHSSMKCLSCGAGMRRVGQKPPAEFIPLSFWGSVSKVEIATSIDLIYKVLFPSISTFATPPTSGCGCCTTGGTRVAWLMVWNCPCCEYPGVVHNPRIMRMLS